MFSGLEKYANSDFLTNILINLSEMQDRNEDYQDALHSLMQAKQILSDNYSEVDKGTCKVKRNISLLYVKINQYD